MIQKYEDVPGFCRLQGRVLTPSRYVGVAEVENKGRAYDGFADNRAAASRQLPPWQQ